MYLPAHLARRRLRLTFPHPFCFRAKRDADKIEAQVHLIHTAYALFANVSVAHDNEGTAVSSLGLDVYITALCAG